MLEEIVPMKIHESAENYLETILVLKRSLGKVRSIDIARALNFSKPSISRAVRLLKADAYITVDSDGWIELEPKGEAIAAKILERHELITQWLIMLGVSPEVASQDACKMEHDLSAETFELLKAHIQAPVHPASGNGREPRAYQKACGKVRYRDRSSLRERLFCPRGYPRRGVAARDRYDRRGVSRPCLEPVCHDRRDGREELSGDLR